MTDPIGWKASPNDSPMDGTIHPMALAELQEWNKIADTWPVYEDREDGRSCVRCGHCNQSIYFLTDKQEHLYAYTPQMIQALKVGHIRRSHPPMRNSSMERQWS